MIEVVLAKFTENAVSNLNLGVLELCCLVSYRFVSLSAVAIVLVLTGLAIPPLKWVGILYALSADTFYCVKIDRARNWSWTTAVGRDSRRREDWETSWPWEFTY